MLHQRLRKAAWPALGALLLAALVLPWSALQAHAQTEQLVINLTGLSSEEEGSAQLVFSVVDADNSPVVDLNEEAFVVELDGQPATVTGVERGIDRSQPISVLLALDVSASMAGPALEEAKAAAVSFLNGLEPNDSVSVLTFADQVNLVVPFTTDKAAAASAVQLLQPAQAGGTTLNQATDDSLRAVSSEGTSYRAVVLLSDGVDNGSTLPQESVLTTAGALGVPVFAIGLGEEIDRAYLEAVATESGGSFAETPSPEGLAQLYAEAGELLRGQYVLTLDTSGLDNAQSEPVVVRVEATSGDRTGSIARSMCALDLCAALTDLAADEQIDASRTVSAEVISADPVASVTFLVDGHEVERLTEGPYQFAFDPDAYESGERTLSVAVETVSGQSLSTDVPVRIGSSGGGISMMTILILGVVAVAVIVAIIWILRRRSGGLPDLDPAGLRPPSKDGDIALSGEKPRIWPEKPLEPLPVPAETAGRLYVEGGELHGESFPVGASPVSIGSSDSCAIKLATANGDGDMVEGEYLRVWVRDDALMLHEVRRMTVTGSTGGRWAKLSPGDVMPIGPYTLRFELGADHVEPESKPSALRDPAIVNEEMERLSGASEFGEVLSSDAGAPENEPIEPEPTPPKGVDTRLEEVEDEPAGQIADIYKDSSTLAGERSVRLDDGAPSSDADGDADAGSTRENGKAGLNDFAQPPHPEG